ncbi:MAG TPA: EAL domain-containing protein [Kofleriaceae bacterium]|nr:EAL domain-containing protein [Kofleriaceae bacterium]
MSPDTSDSLLALPAEDPPGPAERALGARYDHALASLTLAFQPIVRASDHQVIGVEALCRPHPSFRGPAELIAAAQRLGAVRDLGRRVRQLAAAAFHRTRERGLLFVNLHPDDLLDPALASPSAPLAASADHVVFEITEHSPTLGIPDLGRRIAGLREAGYRVAIDDLGAGHARMSLFRPLSADFIKLDMSLSRGIDGHPVKQQLVESIARMARTRGIQTIAEGIETEGEARILAQLGCDHLQGYLFGRPAPLA